MKRSLLLFRRCAILIFALLMASTFVLNAANNISRAKAQQTAEAFLSAASGTKAGVRLSCVNEDDLRQPEGAPFYIFNRAGGGFVIVSGIDAALPVLAWSEESSISYDDMPINLAEMLDLYRYQIANRRKSAEPASAEEIARWDPRGDHLLRLDIPASMDLQTADWGQGSPYNRFCPYDSVGQKTITGCTATAISELLYFYKYPKAGKGTLPGYTKGGITIPSTKLGYDYEWDLMIPKYKGATYTEEQADAAARLIFDIGKMCQAKYGHDATSASLSGGIPKLATYFGFDKANIRYSRTFLSDDSWRDVIKNEIASGHPVLMSASNPSGTGHSFIADGYDSQGRLLINWGWNGSSNGYYYVGAFYGSYNSGNVAFVGVRPNEGGDYVANFALYHTTSSGTEYRGVTYTNGTVSPGKEFSIRFGALYNYGFRSESVEVNFGHFDRNGNMKCLLRENNLSASLSSSSYSWWSSVTLKVPDSVTIEDGDYMEPLYRVSGATKWQRFLNADNPDDQVECQMPMDIHRFSKATFHAGLKKFNLHTFTGTKYSLVRVSDATVVRKGTISSLSATFDMNSYEPGKYVLTLNHGEQTMSIELVR